MPISLFVQILFLCHGSILFFSIICGMHDIYTNIVSFHNLLVWGHWYIYTSVILDISDWMFSQKKKTPKKYLMIVKLMRTCLNYRLKYSWKNVKNNALQWVQLWISWQNVITKTIFISKSFNSDDKTFNVLKNVIYFSYRLRLVLFKSNYHNTAHCRKSCFIS